MSIIRTYRFKLKPTRAQHNRLREALEHSRHRDVAAAQVILHRAVRGPAAANVGGCAERSLRKAVA